MVREYSTVSLLLRVSLPAEDAVRVTGLLGGLLPSVPSRSPGLTDTILNWQQDLSRSASPL